MLLHYYRDPHGNFGDDLNPWLWPKVRPGLLDEDDGDVFVGIGTLLNERLAPRLPAKAHRHVFSTGWGYGDVPAMGTDWTIHCVRGPRTAGALGLHASKAVTDGAALLRNVPLPAAAAGRRRGFMPHHRSAPRAPWGAYCRAFGLRYIDPRWPVGRVLAEIAGCDVLAAEAMHGAIVADTLRVPWVPVFMHEQVHVAKWLDWSDSVAVRLRPLEWAKPLAVKGGARRGLSGRLRAPLAMRRLAGLLEKADGHLSSEARLDALVGELGRRLAKVRPAGARA